MDLVKSAGDSLQQLLAGWRQFNRAMHSPEQSNFCLLFKHRNLPAHRALREAQLFCGECEAQVACNCLKGTEQIQRRKSVLLQRCLSSNPVLFFTS